MTNAKENAQAGLLRRRLRGNVQRNPQALQITLSGKMVQKVLYYLLPPTPRAQEPSLRPTLRPWIDVIDQIIQEDAALTKRLRTTRSCASRPADFFPLTVLPNAPDRMPLLDGSWSPRSAFGIQLPLVADKARQLRT